MRTAARLALSALTAITLHMASAHAYDVTLNDCPKPLPLNSTVVSRLFGSCYFMMAVFAGFGAHAYGSRDTASAALTAKTVTDSRPYQGCPLKSRVELADGIGATVYSWGRGTGETGPCLALWQARGWTFVISGMTPYLWVGGLWTVTANQVVAYVAGHPLPGRGEMGC
jgi:hypothetical protein